LEFIAGGVVIVFTFVRRSQLHNTIVNLRKEALAKAFERASCLEVKTQKKIPFREAVRQRLRYRASCFKWKASCAL
jgi:hypothetical protein